MTGAWRDRYPEPRGRHEQPATSHLGRRNGLFLFLVMLLLVAAAIVGYVTWGWWFLWKGNLWL